MKNNSVAARELGVAEKQVREWRQQRPALAKMLGGVACHRFQT